MNIFFRSVKKHFEDFNNGQWKLLDKDTLLTCDNLQHQNILYFSSQFLHENLRSRINKTPYWKHNCVFVIDDITVQIDIYSLSRKPKGLRHIVWVTAYMIYYCLQCKKAISLKNERRTIDITVVLSPFKKVFPQGEQPLTSFNINSGVTALLSDEEKSVVVIFRREEVIKVLIHELIHAMQIDIHSDNDTHFLKRFFGFPSTHHFNVSETFTETYACLLNVAIASLLSRSSYKQFQERLAQEKEFIIMQGCRVLSKLHFKLDANGILQPNTNTYQETTNTIAYYILKAIVFSNINTFIGLLVSPIWSYKLNFAEFIAFLEQHVFKTSFKKYKNCVHSKTTSLKMSSIDTLKLGY